MLGQGPSKLSTKGLEYVEVPTDWKPAIIIPSYRKGMRKTHKTREFTVEPQYVEK